MTEMKSDVRLGDLHRVFVARVWPPSMLAKRSLAGSRNGVPRPLIDSNLPESHYRGKKSLFGSIMLMRVAVSKKYTRNLIITPL